jgi:CBS domain containing-hemolysin-like protein
LIVLFNGSGTLIMRLFGLEAHAEHSHIHSPDEISMLAAESRAGGILKSEEHRLLRNTLQMRASIVRHVMIPRPRMLAGSSLLSPAKMLMQLADSPFSRIPIYEGTIDNVVGVVHLRDLLCAVTSGSQETVAQLSHNVPFIPETMSVRDAFTLLQKKQFQVAIVLDEFGGTAGMISLEDILEQIFGDLEDEFDAPSPAFRLGAGRRVWIRGEARIAEVNEMLGINLPERDLETLGGLILNRVGHIPIQKETFEIDGVEIRVEEMSGRGIGMVSLGANEEQYRKVQALLNT